MKELNVVDWASQQPSISGTWQLKIKHKKANPENNRVFSRRVDVSEDLSGARTGAPDWAK